MQANNSGSSSTYVMEMRPPAQPSPTKSPRHGKSSLSFPPGSHKEDAEISGSLPPPTIAVPVLQRWNHPRSNISRVFGCFFSFIILGANDGAYGPLIPYLEKYYGIDYTTISLLFLSPIAGYSASALLNNAIHMKFGQRGLAMMMGICHTLAYVLISLHIPYPALVVVFIFAGFGNGLGDSAWNAWIGDMQNPNEVLGFLHAFYGLGAALSPLIATTVVTKLGWQWFEFYYIMIGGAVLELIVLTTVFWKADGAHFRVEHPQLANEVPDSPRESLVAQDSERQPPKQSLLQKLRLRSTKSPKSSTPSKSRTLEAIKNKTTLLAAGFLLVYVGIEVSIGGWIVTFMLRVRGGSPFASGMVSTGFWLGVTVGRLVLGFVTPRLFRAEKYAVAVYIAVSLALELMLWLIPHFVVSAVMVGLLGFFLAPMFPAAVVSMTKLLPKAQHVPAVGFAAALGASGACILPFAVGAIANAKGVQVLQPIILAMLVVMLAVWLCIPTLPKMRTA